MQVPDGQGAYRQVVRYYHVGRGQGDFEPVPETSGTGIGMLPVAATVASLFLVLILAVTLLHISANFRPIPWPSLAKSSSHKSTQEYTSTPACKIHIRYTGFWIFGSLESFEQARCYSFRFLRSTY